MMTIKQAQSIGEVQRYLEAALEHFNGLWGELKRANLIPEPLDDKPDWYPRHARRYPFGAAYTLAAAHRYVYQCHQGMIEFVGTTEGQLCPYQDCAHDLAIELAGWCRCGHCNRPFYVRDSDSDIEDYHARRPKAGEKVPEALLYCRDLGPSWATPEKDGK
jgi:hypothetical protein